MAFSLGGKHGPQTRSKCTERLHGFGYTVAVADGGRATWKSLCPECDAGSFVQVWRLGGDSPADEDSLHKFSTFCGSLVFRTLSVVCFPHYLCNPYVQSACIAFSFETRLPPPESYDEHFKYLCPCGGDKDRRCRRCSIKSKRAHNAPNVCGYSRRARARTQDIWISLTSRFA